MPDQPRHSVSVAGIVVNDRDQVLVIKRMDTGDWQPPGGVLELNETIEEGLLREILEESGVRVSIDTLTGIYKNMRLGVIALVFRCKPIGGRIQTGVESEQVRWMSLAEVEATMTPSFAIRVLDAMNYKGVALRTHDGSGRL